MNRYREARNTEAAIALGLRLALAAAATVASANANTAVDVGPRFGVAILRGDVRGAPPVALPVLV